jgi:hypothetical protein
MLTEANAEVKARQVLHEHFSDRTNFIGLFVQDLVEI